MSSESEPGAPRLRGCDSIQAAVIRGSWVVERTQAWLLGCRRLGVRHDRRADLLQGLPHLARTPTCLHVLAPATG